MDSVTITCGDQRIVVYLNVADGFGEAIFGEGDFGGQDSIEALDGE